MPDCAVLSLLECLAGALAGIGIICLCWSLWRPLHLAQHYGVNNEQGMYNALPIYGYLRRYFAVLLLAGCVVLLVSVVSTVPAILAIKDYLGPSRSAECPSGEAAVTVLAILGLFLGIHLPTVGVFETTRHRHPKLSPITGLVEDVRRRLWGVAVFLLLAIALVALFGALQ